MSDASGGSKPPKIAMDGMSTPAGWQMEMQGPNAAAPLTPPVHGPESGNSMTDRQGDQQTGEHYEAQMLARCSALRQAAAHQAAEANRRQAEAEAASAALITALAAAEAELVLATAEREAEQTRMQEATAVTTNIPMAIDAAGIASEPTEASTAANTNANQLQTEHTACLDRRTREANVSQPKPSPNPSDPSWTEVMETSNCTKQSSSLPHQQLAQSQSTQPPLLALTPVEMSALALREYDMFQDANVRSFTPQEEQVMEEYCAGRLILSGPPNFTYQTLTRLGRAALLRYHTTQLEVTLTAVIPPAATVTWQLTSYYIYRHLLVGNVGEGNQLRVERLQDASVRVQHRFHSRELRFTFADRAAAAEWKDTEFRFVNSKIILRDLAPSGVSDSSGSVTMATLESLYKVHLLGWEGDDNLTIEQFLNRLLGPVVQDVTRTFINGTPKMEDTWTVRFQSKTCPERLVNVRKLNTAGHGTIYLHHPKTDIRKPCQKCLSILHTERGCKSEHMEQLRAKYERTVVGFVPVTAGLHRYDSSQGTLADFLAAVEQAGVISNALIDADDGSQALYFEGENAAAPRPSPSGFVAPELQEVSKRGEWKLLHSPPCSPQGQIHLSPEDVQDDGFVTHSSKSAKRNQRRAKRKAAQGADMAAAARAADQQMKAVRVRNLSKKAADQRMRARMTGHVQPTNCTPEKPNTKDSPIPPQAGKTNPGRTGSMPAQTPTVEQSNAGPLTVRAKTEKENPEVNQATSAMVLTAALPVAPTPCRTRPQLVAATYSEQMQKLSAAEIHEGAHTLQRTAAEGMEVDLQSGNGSSNKQARDRGEKTTMSVEEAEQHAPPSPGKKTKREVKPQPPTCPKKAAPDMLQKAKEQLKEKKSKSPKARSRPPSPSKMAHSMLVPAMSEGDQASGGAESGTASSATLATAEITLIHGDTTGTLRSIGGPSKATRRLFAWPRVNGNDGEDRGPRVRQFRADKRGIQTSLHQYLHPASPSTIDLTTQSLDQHQAELGGQSSTDTTSPLQTTSPRIISTIPGVATAENLDSWLTLLGGELTDVEGNGQCGFLAYYAATVQAGPGLLNMNAEVVKEATNLKRSVIDLALADLHGSIRLGAFDPEAEYVRLFPNPVGTDEPQPWAAAQAIVKYLIMEQGRSIMQRTPPEHWVGPMMLKAMAQLRREPLYVIDVNANGTTSVQRYLYHHDQLPNVAGESPRSLEFEAGYVQLIPAAAAKTIFQRYIDHKALPLVLILHHTTGGGHFNAVNYGHRFQQWCGNNPDEMRLRIHACHQHSQDTNYPDTLLDMEGIVREAIVSRQAIAEEAALESKHPPILRVPDVPTDESDGSHLPPRSGVYRAPHRDHWERYEDLLRVKATTQEPSVLTRYRKRLQQENHTAFVAWTTSQAQSSEFPTRNAANMSIADATLWFVSHAAACRSLLRHLPHPEIVVLEFEKPQLMAWADSEIFERQLAAIRQMQIGDCPDELKEAAHQWGQRCGQGTTEAERLAAACPLSWKKLRDDFPTWVPPMARPAAIQGDEWRVLHLLPWLVKRWKHTMIAAALDQSLAHSYLVHSDVAQACSHAASREDWSLLLHLRETTCAEAGAPSSPIWAERRESN